jgi:glyoxylase-like metal-dependent hydrolase (beta-lactamase superfamily II)
MRLLPAAEFTCSREEWAAARARLAARKGYVGHHLPPEARMRLVDLPGAGAPHGEFASTIDLLGDGSVRLIATPGHTAGHMSVLLRLAGGEQVLLVGDAAYTLRNIREGILPLLTDDDEAALASMRQIRLFAEAAPDAILVPSHDPTAWHALRRVTASAERALAAPA